MARAGTGKGVLIAVLATALGLAVSAAQADDTSHHRTHRAHGHTTAAKRHALHVRPGAAPDVKPDPELAGGSIRHGCAGTQRTPSDWLHSMGVEDAEVAARLEQDAGAAFAAEGECLPYALTLTRAGAVRALALRLPAGATGPEPLLMLSRDVPSGTLRSRTEDLSGTLSEVTSVTLPLQEVTERSAELQAAVPAETLYSLAALVGLLQTPTVAATDAAPLVRAAYETGSGPEAGRLLSVELVDPATHQVLREALWIERAGLPGGYFAPDGTSYEHALWTSPVTFTRISRGIGNFRTTVRRPVTRRSGHRVRVVMARSTRRGTHVGVDFAAPIGTPVVSVADGHVVDVGPRGGYGNLIVIEHAGGYTTRYAHLSAIAPDIEIGAEVRRGSEIGYVGSTGFSTGPHLHFEIRRDGVYLDPLDERLAFGLWSMRPVDYLPMMRQTLISEASDAMASQTPASPAPVAMRERAGGELVLAGRR